MCEYKIRIVFIDVLSIRKINGKNPHKTIVLLVQDILSSIFVIFAFGNILVTFG